jgi:Glucose / Sorbosone dehydrogenase
VIQSRGAIRGGRRQLVVLAAITAALLGAASSAAAVTLQPIGTYSFPVFVTSDPTDPDRLFVVEQEGRIRLTTGGQTTTFVDLSSIVLSFADTGGGAEHGLFSMAFAPDYATSGRFYVFYTGADTDAYVGELTASGNSADPATLETAIKIEHTGVNNHYGGQLQFGPDGQLYISMGDGAAPGDPFENAQDTSSLLGKILRISPIHGGGYSIPADNPFATTAGSDEIWSYGLRNPWRFSFDRQTGDLFVGDVGQGAWEEIDFDPVGMGAGRGDNFGWDCYEGREPFADAQSSAGCPDLADTTQPVLVYPNPAGDNPASVTGGYVVRDPGLAELYGRYVYADFYAGGIRSFVPAVPDALDDRSEGVTIEQLVSFGEDSCGRVYAVSLGGPVFRLTDDTPTDCAEPPEPAAGPSGDQVQARALSLDANKNQVRKGKKVVLSGDLDAPGHEAECESGQTVKLLKARPGNSAFRPIEELQTDPHGSFSIKQKVRRSYKYRAEVEETSACAYQLSNIERVKVKKSGQGK